MFVLRPSWRMLIADCVSDLSIMDSLECFKITSSTLACVVVGEEETVAACATGCGDCRLCMFVVAMVQEKRKKKRRRIWRKPQPEDQASKEHPPLSR